MTAYVGADPHEVLGVRRDATPRQVTQAFRREVLRGGHPDTGGDARAFRRLVAARDALLDQRAAPGDVPPASPSPGPRAPRPAGPARPAGAARPADAPHPAPASSDASALPLIVGAFLFFVAMPHVLLAIVLVLVP
ncbi:J domain-containing protein [Jiangella aurantiaca]|uniref:J domain-containing protein n=1 Tax=Jiangella aurantiaca TaxID=2530373 RepID=UPI00193D42B8|nr:J domain-containing protein [Jiangella aurantiaca]